MITIIQTIVVSVSILGISIIVFCIGRFLFYMQRAVTAGKRATPVSKINAGAQRRILVIGDSTSYGTAAQKPENSLVGRLVHDFPEFEIINESENAMDITRMYEKLLSMTGQEFDIVMLHIGGMDTLSFTPSSTITSYTGKIRECTRRMGVHTVALVSMNNIGALPLMHFPLNRIYNARSRRITKLFAQTCTSCDVVHIPLFTEIQEEPLLQNGKNHFSEDKMHPNDTGYGIWYQKIKTAIEPHITK